MEKPIHFNCSILRFLRLFSSSSNSEERIIHEENATSNKVISTYIIWKKKYSRQSTILKNSTYYTCTRRQSSHNFFLRSIRINIKLIQTHEKGFLLYSRVDIVNFDPIFQRFFDLMIPKDWHVSSIYVASGS